LFILSKILLISISTLLNSAWVIIDYFPSFVYLQFFHQRR
jgi:hypothetical protein